MCTGISLTATDGGVVTARTVEWALSDAHHDRVALFGRGRRFTAQTPTGLEGKQRCGRVGFDSPTRQGHPYRPHGMDDQGHRWGG